MAAGNCLRNAPPCRAAFVRRMVNKVAFAGNQFVNQLVNIVYHQNNLTFESTNNRYGYL
jgi:hypothetical protein